MDVRFDCGHVCIGDGIISYQDSIMDNFHTRLEGLPIPEVYQFTSSPYRTAASLTVRLYDVSQRRHRPRSSATIVVQIPHNHAFVSFFDFLAFFETKVLDPPVGEERGVDVMLKG